MNINKFKKIGSNKYKVYIDNEPITLYEDIILKYDLLYKKDIEKKILDKIKQENKEFSIYDFAVKYIDIRLRSEKEIRKYLQDKEFDNKSINDVIKTLTNQNLINDNLFCKSFINDKLNLTNWGNNKIKQELLKLGISEEIIEKSIDIEKDILVDRIKSISEKEIKINTQVPKFKLRNQIINKCMKLGYDYEDILNVVDNIKIDSKANIKKEYEKLYDKYKKKYEGTKLILFLKNKLYQRGYTIDEINNIFE